MRAGPSDWPTGEKLTGSDRTEAKDRNEAARLWFTGLRAIRDEIGIKTVYDLSATPVGCPKLGLQPLTCRFVTEPGRA